jgi:hypothetical protein
VGLIERLGAWWRRWAGSSRPGASRPGGTADDGGGSGSVEVGPGYRYARWKGVTAFHLWWQGLGRERLVEVAATLEILEEPRVRHTYFWALQATFADDRRSHGAAHLGPQWYPRFADSRAMNWGGYASPPDQAVLAGTPPALPGFADDPNTRGYPWRAGVPYRLRIRRGERGWAGEVTDTSTGARVVLRELLAGGDHLRDVVMWAEVFAPCESPPTLVRWSDLAGLTADGRTVRPDRVSVSLPAEGNCPNTDVVVDGVGICQLTGAVRRSRAGDVLAVPRPGS